MNEVLIRGTRKSQRAGGSPEGWARAGHPTASCTSAREPLPQCASCMAPACFTGEASGNRFRPSWTPPTVSAGLARILEEALLLALAALVFGFLYLSWGSLLWYAVICSLYSSCFYCFLTDSAPSPFPLYSTLPPLPFSISALVHLCPSLSLSTSVPLYLFPRLPLSVSTSVHIHLCPFAPLSLSTFFLVHLCPSPTIRS